MLVGGSSGLASLVPAKGKRTLRQQEPSKPLVTDPVQAARDRVAATKERKLLDSQVARLTELEAMAGALEAAASATPRALPFIQHSASKRQAVAVAMLSDLHYGEVVLPDASTFGNAYNVKIAEYRLARFFDGVCWNTRNIQVWADVSAVVLWLGGDLITGHIHEDLAETALAPIPSILALQPLLVDGIRQIEAIGVPVQIVCSYGNHGRTTTKKRIETGAHHSYEWGMYQEIARRFPGQVIANPKSHQYLDIGGEDEAFRLHFTHGDEVQYAGGVGGPSIPLNKATSGWNDVYRCHYHHYGHFHQGLEGRDWLVNGSVIGYNDYAMSIKAKPEPAQQWFYALDSKRGRTAKSPLWVEDRAAEARLI